MKKIFLAIAMFVAAGFVGCADSDEVGYVIESKVLIPRSGLQEIALTETTTAINYEVWVYRSGYNEGSSTATLAVDTKALADYNTANKTAYEMMPEAYYEFTTTTVQLDNAVHTRKVAVKLDVSKITEGSLYVLPISVSSQDTEVSASDAAVLIFPAYPKAEEPEDDKD